MTNNTSLPGNPASKLHGLDHLRTLAISFVFIYHYSILFPSPAWLGAISKFGWTGVDLFFVLSGYLIAAQLFAGIQQGKPVSFKIFFIKRFFRIIPAYLLVVVIYLSFPIARERGTPAPLWKYLSFTQNLGLNLRTQATFSHAWSLCIEEQFYLLLPLILIALLYFKAFKKAGWLLPALFAFGLVARWYVYTAIVEPVFQQTNDWAFWYKWIYYPTYSRLDGLLTGVAIAALFQFRPGIRNKLLRYGNLLLLLSLVVLAIAYYICIDQVSLTASVLGFPLISIGYALMVMGVLSPAVLLYKKASSFTASIAALSYGIYLTHKMMAHLTQLLLAKTNIDIAGNLSLLICTIACIGAAWLLRMLVEKPFLRLRTKVLALEEPA